MKKLHVQDTSRTTYLKKEGMDSLPNGPTRHYNITHERSGEYTEHTTLTSLPVLTIFEEYKTNPKDEPLGSQRNIKRNTSKSLASAFQPTPVRPSS